MSDEGAPKRTRNAKVEPQEYVETPVVAESAEAETVVEEASVETEAAPAPKAKKSKNTAWEVGKPAPYNVYWDHETQSLTATQPVRSRGIVAEGQIVTAPVLEQIEKGGV